MSTKAIPKRSEVPVEDTWDLSDIFPTEEAWQAEFEAMKELPAKAAAFRGTLGRSAKDLLAWFRLQDDISVRLTKLHGYANCHSDEDTADSHYVDMKSKAMSVIVAISAAAAFATPEIMAIPEDTLASLSIFNLLISCNARSRNGVIPFTIDMEVNFSMY